MIPLSGSGEVAFSGVLSSVVGDVRVGVGVVLDLARRIQKYVYLLLRNIDEVVSINCVLTVLNLERWLHHRHLHRRYLTRHHMVLVGSIFHRSLPVVLRATELQRLFIGA